MNHARDAARNADRFDVELPLGDNTIVAEVSVDYKDVEIHGVWLIHPDCPDARMPFEIDGLMSRKRKSFKTDDIASLIELAAHEALL